MSHFDSHTGNNNSKKEKVNEMVNGHHKDKNGNTELNANSNESSSKAEDGSAEESDVLEIIQDVGFSVQILSPGVEPLTIQVSSMELVQEIHQLLMDRDDTCHRTCFSLQLDGVTLDNFAELKNIEGLKEGSIIKVVEEPYTMREARIHVRHVRDLLKSMDPADAYNGVDCNSLTFLHTITQGEFICEFSFASHHLCKLFLGDLQEKKKTRPDSVDCTPPEYIMPNAKERPLLPLQPGVNSKVQKIPQAIKVLTTSAWVS
jgi:protein TIF31